MQVNKVSSNSGSDSYAARLYQQKLDEMYVQRIVDHRKKVTKQDKAVEVSKLNDYNEDQRLAKNQLILKQYNDMRLYLFQCGKLKLQENKNIQLGTKVDTFS